MDVADQYISEADYRDFLARESEQDWDGRPILLSAIMQELTRAAGVKQHLEYLRGQLRAERISTGELIDLQGYGEGGFIATALVALLRASVELESVTRDTLTAIAEAA